MENSCDESRPLTYPEIIRETIEFYAPGDKFSIDRRSGVCLYLDPITGNRCAVGRCLIPGGEADEEMSMIADLWRFGRVSTSSFKPRYRASEVVFWSRLQALHDAWANGTDPSNPLRRVCDWARTDPVEILRGIEFPGGKNPFLEYA